MSATITSTLLNSGLDSRGAIRTDSSNSMAVKGTGLGQTSSITLTCAGVDFGAVALGTTSDGEVNGTFSASSTAPGPLTVHIKLTDTVGNTVISNLSTWIWYPSM